MPKKPTTKTKTAPRTRKPKTTFQDPEVATAQKVDELLPPSAPHAYSRVLV